MAIIGIDLGTTNSLAAQLDATGNIQVIHNAEGSNLTPSVVWFVSPSNIVVGEEAKKNLGIEPNVFKEFKRKLGSDTAFPVRGGTKISPTELTAFVLKKIIQDVRSAVGDPQTVIITVPANFRNEAREATLKAASDAGISADALLNEPTAAALYYARHFGKQLNGLYAVYDLGGGTFDFSVIRANGDDIEVVASDGVQELGGKDFDQKIMGLVRRKFRSETGISLDLSMVQFSDLDAEDVKKSLSIREERKIRIVGDSVPVTTITITRREFEAEISSLMAQAEMLCEGVLMQANLKPTDLEDVFLAGGSSRMPIVRRSLQKLFGKEPVVTGNPDEAIALGAAIYAGYKAEKGLLNPLQARSVQAMTLQEISPHFLGTICRDSAKASHGIDADLNDILIRKNVPLPCSVTRSFYTISENQTSVTCVITQSPQPESDPKFVRILWRGVLELPPNRAEGQEIAVTFAYDESGVIRASFLDVATGRKTEIDVKSQGAGSKSEVNINDFVVE